MKYFGRKLKLPLYHDTCPPVPEVVSELDRWRTIFSKTSAETGRSLDLLETKLLFKSNDLDLQRGLLQRLSDAIFAGALRVAT